MLLLKCVPVIALALQRVHSTPWGTLNGRSNTSSAADGLVKRVAPSMGPNGGGFTQAEQVQIVGGWKDACKLANVAYARVGRTSYVEYMSAACSHEHADRTPVDLLCRHLIYPLSGRRLTLNVSVGQTG